MNNRSLKPGPQDILEVFPLVLADIRRRMERYRAEQESREQREQQRRVLGAVAGYMSGRKPSRRPRSTRSQVRVKT